ncbi:BppU family phage baseplate upper protein [uncultured Eubacterium sp.]|uniref:BppU family phage baseplate upper protein n=1 Tax=uncultured Eubacterium sp. TaxID=165185 RepID=UPI00259623EA|nr:BppU family phage baseplate upper protein [uncultured Eubacterium sp.]
MELVINKLNLDVMKSGIQATVNCKKGDILTRAVVASFRMNGQTYKVPNGATAVFRAKKPDGTVIYNNATVQDGKVHFIFTSQYCAVAGKYTGEIQLIKSGKVLYTPKFCISVEDNIYSDSEIESTNEYTQLTESIEDAEEALQIAQNLHLIEYVNNLDSPGDDKYLYVLEETAPYFTLTDFPTAVSSGTMFESTDETYPLLLFTGMILQENKYEDTGVVQFRSFVNPSATGEQTSMFGYDVANEKWVKLQDFDYYGDDALNTGDELILTDEAAGEVHDPVVTDYVIKSNPKYEVEPTRNTRVVYIYDNDEHSTIYYYIFTSTGNVSFTEDSNVIDLDNIPELLVGDSATPYVYDEVENKYVGLLDALTPELLARLAAAEDNIDSLKDRMDVAETDIESLESDVNYINDELDFYITINHTSTNPICNKNYNQINQSLGVLMYTNPRIKLVYKDSNNNKCYAAGTWQRQVGIFEFCFNTSEKTKTETRVYQLNTNNTWSVTINSQTNQAKLTAGTNITIDNTDPDNPVISSVGGGGSTSNPIYYKENNILKCTMTYAEVLYFIQHQNELFRPQLKMSTLSIYDFYFVDTFDDYIWIIFKGSISGDSPSQETRFYIIKHYSDETISLVNYYETSYQKKINQLSNNSGIILANQGISDAIAVRIKSNNGIDVDNQGIYAKLKSNGGINVDSNGLFVDQNLIQAKLTEGNNITIENNVISAESETYTAGEGIDIDSNNAISLKITDEAEGGSVVSFSNAGENLPLKSCTVAIEPVQDLHGYDHPWAGGSGKNIINAVTVEGHTSGTYNNVAYSISNGVITLNGLCNASGNINITTQLALTSGTKYSMCDFAEGTFPNNSSARLQLYKANAIDINTLNNSASNYVVSGTCQTTTEATLRIRVASGHNYQNCKLKPMIMVGEVSSMSYEPYSNICPISGWTECNITVADDETTPTVSNVYNIEFPSQAGTVYGGTLDITNGVMEVNYISVDMSSLEWKLNTKSGSRIRTDENIAKSIGSATIISNTLSSQYKTITSSDWYNKNERGVTITYSSQGSDGAIGLNDDGIINLTSITDIQTYLSGIQLVYELATPTTYQLTPTEIKTLLGINNIFADCGDVETPVTYYTEAGEDILYLALHGIPAAKGSEF